MVQRNNVWRSEKKKKMKKKENQKEKKIFTFEEAGMPEAGLLIHSDTKILVKEADPDDQKLDPALSGFRSSESLVLLIPSFPDIFNDK